MTVAAPLPADHPFATESPLPFAAPPFDRIRDEHFAPALLAGMAEHRAEVRAIATQAAPPTFANTLEALERSGRLLQRVSKVFFNLTESATNPERQRIQAEVAPLLAAHHDAIHLDAELFARVAAVHAARHQLPDPEQRRLAERYHLAFVRSGAELPPAAQAELRRLNAELAERTTRFQELLLADTAASAVLVEQRAELRGLDDSAVSAAAAAAADAGHPGKFLLGLQLPSSQPLLAALDDRGLRERLHRAALQRGARGGPHDTREQVLAIARLRARRAALFGMPDHATWALADQVAGSPQAVRAMLDRLLPAIRAKAAAEAAELRQAFAEHHPGAEFAAWDWAWTAARLRASRYACDDAVVRQYFALDRVLRDGVFLMAERLYGLRLAERRDLPVYHEDVRVFDVFDHDGSQLGLFYADYFARPGKRGGAWMDAFVEPNGLLGDRPVVVNVMNLPKPGPGQPALLGFDEVTTLFHEFGHALHGLCSRARFPLLAGTAVPRDYVEFPSQFHEDFAFDAEVLARCARHHRTGEPLPAELLQRLRAARRFGQGFALYEYAAAALLDLAWHELPDGAAVADALAFEAAALQRAGMADPCLPPRYRSSYFAHIWPGGYAAGYYAYLWSEALAADAFEGLQQAGGMTRANGQRVRDTVLSRGMVEEPMQQFRACRGRDLDPTALLRRRGLV